MTEITDSAYEMLRAAVNVARNIQVENVQALKEQLNSAYPDRQADIDSAISFWADEIRCTHPRGVRRI